MDALSSSLPYLGNTCSNHFVGLLVVNYVFHHTIFLNPAVGFYHQKQGWPMGTNAAPAWLQLMLRTFESQHLNRNDLILLQFLDDGLILHCCTYPPNLPFSFDLVDCVSDITFLDNHIVIWHPLHTSIFSKPTHTCPEIS